MVDILHIRDRFYKYKDVLACLFIDHYGEEYADIIKSRLEKVWYDFSSTPNEEYNFMQKHKDQFDIISKIFITLNYKDFSLVQKRVQESHYSCFMEYIQRKWPIQPIDEKSEQFHSFISLFTNESFERGSIDYLGSKFMELLDDASIYESKKDFIREEQEKMRKLLQLYGIKKEDISTDDVDDLIRYRKLLKLSYQNSIVENSQFGKHYNKTLKKVVNYPLSFEDTSSLAFKKDAYAGIIRINIEEDSTDYHLMKMPLLHLMNYGIKALDVFLIHELIHKIETNNGYAGITCLFDNVNEIVNEIRTQNLAIKLTKKLHELGIYIYDNPDNLKYEGDSTYEIFFPSTKEFFDKHEKFFSDCAINNSLQQLVDYFGESFQELSSLLNVFFDKYMYFSEHSRDSSCIFSDERITEFIQNMNQYREQKVKILEQ